MKVMPYYKLLYRLQLLITISYDKNFVNISSLAISGLIA